MNPTQLRSDDVSTFPPIGHVGIPQNQQSWIGAGASLLVLSILLRHCLQFIELGLNSLLSLWGSSEMTGGVGYLESNR